MPLLCTCPCLLPSILYGHGYELFMDKEMEKRNDLKCTTNVKVGDNEQYKYEKVRALQLLAHKQPVLSFINNIIQTCLNPCSINTRGKEVVDCQGNHFM